MTNIVEAIYSLYYQEPKTRKGRKPTASSGLASICPRYAWYEANSPRVSEIPSLLRRRMKYGIIHEDHIRDELRELPDWEIKGAQLDVTLWGVKGKIDLLVRENGKWKLLEIKTMNPEDFKKFQERGLIEFPRYYEQFMFYLGALSLLPFKESIETGILLAENTFPLGQLHAEELDLDLYCLEQMERNKETLDQVLGLVEPPTRSFTYESKECKRCWRREECWRVLQPTNCKSFTQVKDPTKVKDALLEYLRSKQQLDKSSEKIDEIKSFLRSVMDEEKITELSVDLGLGFYYNVTLKEVTVKEHLVKEYSSPRLMIR